MLELVSITKSDKPEKKYVATFRTDNRLKHTYFGSAGMTDYTLSKDDDRKERYLARHIAREHWNDPTTPGALARWILWNKKSVRASILDYRKRFDL